MKTLSFPRFLSLLPFSFSPPPFSLIFPNCLLHVLKLYSTAVSSLFLFPTFRYFSLSHVYTHTHTYSHTYGCHFLSILYRSQVPFQSVDQSLTLLYSMSPLLSLPFPHLSSPCSQTLFDYFLLSFCFPLFNLSLSLSHTHTHTYTPHHTQTHSHTYAYAFSLSIVSLKFLNQSLTSFIRCLLRYTKK